MQENYGIHWFRRDLRVAGNAALQENWKINKGRVVGVFCFDKKFLSRPDFSVNRFQFFMNTLVELRDEMRSIGSDLLFLDIGPEEAFSKLFETLKKENKLPSLFSVNRDYEPFSRIRDEKISKLIKSFGVSIKTRRDHLLIEPHEVYRGKVELGYKVFTPFSRKWLEAFVSLDVQKRIDAQKKGFEYLKKNQEDLFSLTWKDILKSLPEDSLKKYQEENLKKVSIPIPASGLRVALKELDKFKEKVKDYNDKRDYPSVLGTSKMSMFLKNGSITVPQIIAYLDLDFYEKKDKSGEAVYFSELIWREFYYHVLYRWPQVEQEAFMPKYKNLKWENNKKWFEAWKEGKTGFPIVDAGMRELKETGWMHNRVRMIVASFLTKDLLIDWKWGEKYFMEVLLDGDLAPNNGGWQWAASTGCDAQPYFRIFNPWSQSKRFDLNGDYIKKYIPELEGLDSKKLHSPILGHETYPAPIVEHSEQRIKALAMYKVDNP